jgi:hypothetical protein
MKTKVSILLAAAAAAAYLSIGTARASSVTSLFDVGTNTAHDVDVEYLANDPSGTNTLEVGSVIAGYLDFSQLLNPHGPALGLNSGNDQLTAFFDVEVTSVGPDIGGGNHLITFGPDTSGTKFSGGLVNSAGTTFASQYGAGAMIAVYTANSSQPGYLNSSLSATTTMATAAAGTTAGSLYWVLGFNSPSTANTGTTGEGWAALGPTAFDLTNVSTGTIATNVNFAVNLLPGGSGPGIGPGALAEQTIDAITAPKTQTLAGSQVTFIGTSTIRGTGSPAPVPASPYNATSDSDVTFLIAAAPLPSAAWSGLALLGLMGVGSLLRRRSNSAV